MKALCVFCGASLGSDPAFVEAARAVGRGLAERGLTLVYGGGQVGLMGVVADGALAAGGQVIGVIPQFLKDKELAHTGVSELIVTRDMHERKRTMFELSQGFLALPGGYGTLEEIVEIMTWRHLSIHRWPIGFLNVNGYYDKLRDFFDHMVTGGLLSNELRDWVEFEQDVDAMLNRLTTQV